MVYGMPDESGSSTLQLVQTGRLSQSNNYKFKFFTIMKTINEFLKETDRV